MTSKIPKRLGALFLSLALCLTMLPATALAAAGDVTYLYCDTNGASWTTDTKRSDEYTVVTDNTTSWGSKSAETWLVVNSNVTISERITVTGDVHLILMDNCNLTASQGITVEDGDSLTIYAQSDGDGMGALIANGSWAAAGIGGTDGASAGNITICGGSIKAQGGYANSGGGAGIGGGTNGSGGTISIYGGKVDASANGGAGIGSGFKNKSDITTNGGTITITGGVVSTYSEWGACIGGGYASGNGSFSTGTDGNAIIFATGPRTKIADETNKSSWSGIVFAYSSWDAHTGTVYGASVELTSDFEVPNGVTLTIPNGSTLTIP